MSRSAIGLLLLWGLAAPGLGAQAPRTQEMTIAMPVGDTATGRDAFADLKCTVCHRVTGDGDLDPPVAADLGPDLGSRLSQQPAGLVATSIVAPSHVISTQVSETAKQRLQGTLSAMGDFSRAMTVRQLIDLVAYLRSLGE